MILFNQEQQKANEYDMICFTTIPELGDFRDGGGCCCAKPPTNILVYRYSRRQKYGTVERREIILFWKGWFVHGSKHFFG